ncbi:MAG: hypothetical protein ACO3S6_03455 [Aquiluna sp.]
MSQKAIADAELAVEKALVELAAMRELAASKQISPGYAQLKLCRAELELKTKRAQLEQLKRKR